MQKVAENHLSLYGIQLSIAFFAFALGVAYIILFIQDRRMFLTGVTGFFILLVGACLPFIPPSYLAKSKLKSFRRIILNAEKRILSEGSEPNQPQDTTNTSLQKQENPPVSDYNVDSLLVDFGWLGRLWKIGFRDPNDEAIEKKFVANNDV